MTNENDCGIVPEKIERIIAVQENVIKKLRENISENPSGLVRLDLDNNYFQGDFVKKCINELNVKVIMQEKLSDLERLAVCLLFDTANIPLPTERKK